MLTGLAGYLTFLLKTGCMVVLSPYVDVPGRVCIVVMRCIVSLQNGLFERHIRRHTKLPTYPVIELPPFPFPVVIFVATSNVWSSRVIVPRLLAPGVLALVPFAVVSHDSGGSGQVVTDSDPNLVSLFIKPMT